MNSLLVKVLSPFRDTWSDYPSNDGSAVLVYFIGCEHNCKGCHNEKLQAVDSSEGIYVSLESFNALIEKATKKYRTNKLVFEGGDPLHPKNREFVKIFLEAYNVNDMYEVCIYTGYNLDVLESLKLNHFTFIKSGKFIEDKFQEPGKTDSHICFASNNQKLYNKDLKEVSSMGKYYFNKGRV